MNVFYVHYFIGLTGPCCFKLCLFEKDRSFSLCISLLLLTDFRVCITFNIWCKTVSILFCSTDERESVQKKTFQKWVNSHLVRVGSRITDLYVDMRDGKMLIKLLEVLSGERLVSIDYNTKSKCSCGTFLH